MGSLAGALDYYHVKSLYFQIEELKQSHSHYEHESTEAAVLQETVIGLEEQLADKNRVTEE